MSLSLRILLQRILTVLLPLSITSVIYLYLYPVFHGCAFPVPVNEVSNSSGSSWLASNAFVNTVLQHIGPQPAAQREDGRPAPAIFRLLVLADPQIEGDSSLPGPDDEFIPRLRRHWAAVTSTLRTTAEDENSTTSSGDASLDSDDDDDADENDDKISFLSAVQSAFRDTVLDLIPFALRTARKRLDLFGNDYYLAHIYRTLHWWSRPTHVAVLGDLIGSQWVTDEEFEQRGWRYWNRVFRGGERVGDDVTITGTKNKEMESDEEEGDGNGNGNGNGQQTSDLEMLQRYDSPWAKRIINVAGNHDIGYAGDVTEARLERFERVFGRPDWDLRFQHPLEDLSSNLTSAPTLHIINLNDLTLDTPALIQQLQSDSYAYINDVIAHRSYPVEDRTSFTLLLTHVPLHKREGICTDAPYFAFHEDDDEQDGEDGSSSPPRFKKGGLKEQNHLSEHVSTNGILQGIFGMSGDGGWGRKGLILTGHDHMGCDVVHFVNTSSTTPTKEEEEEGGGQSWHWDATPYTPSVLSSSSSSPSIREVTLRSMMGEYGGNAGLLSVWFDPDPAVNEWQYEISTCAAGVQHIWWAIHGVLLATCIGLIGVMALATTEVFLGRGGGGNSGGLKEVASSASPKKKTTERNQASYETAHPETAKVDVQRNLM